MDLGAWLRTVVVLAMTWFVVRFLLVAVAFALRGGDGRAARWLRRLEVRGDLRTTARSGSLLGQGLRGLGDMMARLVGRGAAGSLTFALLAGTLLFLWSLPLNQLYEARAVYDGLRRQLADSRYSTTAPLAACVTEHTLREIERLTGRPIMNVPPGFRLYPLDDDSLQWLEGISPGYDLDLYFREFLAGNKLTDDPRDIRPELRTHPRFEAAIKRLTRDGKVDPALADFVVHSPENAALNDDIGAFCSGNALAANRTFKPVRPRTAYATAAERFQRGAIAVLDDPLIRESYYMVQQRSAEMQLLISLIYSLLAGFLLLLSLRMAIALCRARPQRSLVVNLLRIALSLPAILVVVMLFTGFNSAFKIVAPIAVGFAVAHSPAEAVEQDYRRRAAHFVDRIGRLARQTCDDIGPRSPLTPWCRFVDASLEPWDAQRGTFDFEAAIPRQMDGKRMPGALVTMMQKGMLNAAMAGQALKDEPGLSGGLDFWGGMKSSPTALLLLVPLFLVLAAGIILLVAVDARRILARRLAERDL